MMMKNLRMVMMMMSYNCTASKKCTGFRNATFPCHFPNMSFIWINVFVLFNTSGWRVGMNDKLSKLSPAANSHVWLAHNCKITSLSRSILVTPHFVFAIVFVFAFVFVYIVSIVFIVFISIYLYINANNLSLYPCHPLLCMCVCVGICFLFLYLYLWLYLHRLAK